MRPDYTGFALQYSRSNALCANGCKKGFVLCNSHLGKVWADVWSRGGSFTRTHFGDAVADELMRRARSSDNANVCLEQVNGFFREENYVDLP